MGGFLKIKKTVLLSLLFLRFRKQNMESTTPFLLQVEAMIRAFVPPELATMVMRYFAGSCSVGALLHLTTFTKTKGDCFCMYPDFLHVMRVFDNPTAICFFRTGHDELRKIQVLPDVILSNEALIDYTSAKKMRILLNIQPYTLEPEFLELDNEKKSSSGQRIPVDA